MSMDSGAESVHRIGVVEIDVRRRVLCHAGQVVAVEPKTFDLLLYLVRHADRAVRREELMDAIWPGVVVSEDTLSSAIRRVRDALGPERQRLVVLRRVGYRLVAFPGSDSDPDPDIGSAATGAAGAVPAPGDVPSLVAADPEREAGGTPYIGRAGELAALRASVERGLGGNGGFLSLSGDAGAGKSRTAAELAWHARGLGAEAIQARCYEGDGGQPLWPWVQVFRRLAAARSAAELAEALGAEARDIAVLTAAVAGSDASPPADPAMQRVRLFDSAVAVLRRSARGRPLLIVLDDLHWADGASLLLLRALADEVAGEPIVLVGTHREAEVAAGHPLAGVLAALRRQRTVHHVRLGNLGFADVATLLESLAGARVDQRVAAAVHAATEGNPLFVREYWHDLVETGSVARDAGGWRSREEVVPLGMPATVSDIISRRLQRLPRETMQVLAVAATIGRDFDYDLVLRVTDLDPDAIIDALDEATVAGIVEDAAGAPGSYRFTHALVRQGLYEGMTPLRRAALHRAVGETLRAVSPPDAGPDRIAELAYHFLSGAPTGGHEAAVDYATAAARAATHACAYDEAVGYLRRAIAVWEKRGADERLRRRRCELQLQLAEALGRAGDGVAMRAAFEDAAQQARALPAPDYLARAAIGMTTHWLAEDEAAVARLEEALVALPVADVDLRARTAARLAKTLYFFPETRARREGLCAEARTLAAAAVNPGTLAEVLADSLEALFHGDSLPQQDELVAALGDASAAAGDRRLRLMAGSWRIVNAMRHGRLNEADDLLGSFTRLARELRQPRFLHHAASFDTALLLARARLEQAEVRIAETLALGTRIDPDAARWIHWVHLYHLRREQGRLEEFLDEGLARQLPPATMGALSYERTSRWAAPHLFCELGREDEARAAFEALMAEGLDALPPENARNIRIPVLFSLGDACVTIGDARSAAMLYDCLAPYADQWHVVAWGSVVFASTHLMLGALAAVQKRWETSAEHFAEATRQHVAQNAVCAQARLLYHVGGGGRGRGGPPDERAAARMIGDGLRLANAHGLPGIARRLERLAAAG
jgi:DNA-binding winged helix-turn-helix (wHTH) protein